MKLFRRLALVLLYGALALGLYAAAQYVGTAMPYHDAPPALLVKQAQALHNASLLFGVAALIGAASALALWLTRRTPSRPALGKPTEPTPPKDHP